MKVFDLSIMESAGNIESCILIHSFEEYKELGGTRDMLDVYSIIKARAKDYESKYIDCMDMACSGIPVEDKVIRKYRLLAQTFWYILHLWFNKPLREVNYRTFDFNEFNAL